jgi:hypothetical protein
MGVMGLHYTAVNPHLQFLKNKYCNKLMGENLLQTAEDECPVSMIPFSILLGIITFSSQVALNCKSATLYDMF